MHNGPERRTPKLNEVDHLELLIERQLDQHLEVAMRDIKLHISAELDKQKELIKSAFPEGDMHSHMLAHKEMNKLAADRAERWNKLWDRILVGGGYSIAAAIALALWEAFKDGVRR